MFLMIWFVYLGSVNSFPDNSSTLCFLHNNFTSTPCNDEFGSLSCSEDQYIRIKEIQISNKTTGNTGNCSCCNQQANQSHWDTIKDIVYFETFLYQACSRKSKCSFSQDDILQSNETTKYLWKANIKYECVEKDLFKDLCSPWRQETDSVHISLNTTGNATSNCSCSIMGNPENASIEVVDYRPYINDIECAGNSVEVDCIDLFECTETDFSVYNKNLTVVNNVTDLIFLFGDYLPKMIWIHVKGNNLTVKCNDSGYRPVHLCSMSTVDTTSTTTLSIVPETETVPKMTTTEESNTTTTFPPFNNEGSTDRSIFSLPVIAGGSAGLLALIVIITVIICILCRRKSNTKDNGKEKMYAVYHAESNTANISTRTDSATKEGYKTENNIVHITMKDTLNSNYEEVGKNIEEADADGGGDDTVYAEPADVVDNINAETDTGMQMSNKAQNKTESVNYTEPYDKALVIDNKSQNDYAKVIKCGRKKEAYDTCTGIDKYSHIQIGKTKQVPKTEDNYSHIQIAGNKNESSCSGNYSHTKVRPRDESKPQECSDMYSHVEINTTKQQDLADTGNKSVEVDNNSTSLEEVEEEEEEYDHLNNFSHH